MPMFRNSGLGFFTASAILDPYYVVTLTRDFSAFSYRGAAKNLEPCCGGRPRGYGAEPDMSRAARVWQRLAALGMATAAPQLKSF